MLTLSFAPKDEDRYLKSNNYVDESLSIRIVQVHR
jgi:hypothetical protein